MGRGIQAFYGLRLNGELIGANCLGKMGGTLGILRIDRKKAGCLSQRSLRRYAPPRRFFLHQSDL